MFFQPFMQVVGVRLSSRTLSMSRVFVAVPQRHFATSLLKRVSAKNEKPSVNSTNALLSALRYKGRTVPKKKKLTPGNDAWSVIGYATAESYDLYSLASRLQTQGLYEPVHLEDELTSTCLCVTSKYNFDTEDRSMIFSKDIYFFADGTTVFWNIPELERDTVLSLIRSKDSPIEQGPFDVDDIYEESEMMTVKMGAENQTKSTHLDAKGVINMKTMTERDHNFLLEQYAFSNAIGSSVKLGMLEASLDKLIDSIEFLSEDMKAGRDVKMSQKEVLKKSGEIFAMRHVVNLSSDLLDAPDFYWDRENLESLFLTTCSHLAINKRTRVMNEKLTHLCELMELIRTHLSDKHHVRLEWFIIALIWVEVIFECLHFVERFL